VAVGILILLWRHYLPSYFGEKGKNLATKEDIGAITREIESVKALYTYAAEKGKNAATKEDIEEITDKIESVKRLYSEELELVRATLGSRSHTYHVRYEREFDIVLELTEKLVDLRNAALSLRPIMRLGDREKSELRDEYFRAERALTRFADTRRPFFPEGIYQALYDVGQAAWAEAVQHGMYTPDNNPNYWTDAQKNAETILTLSNNALDMIRARVQRWERFDPGAGVSGTKNSA
jgi:hypothetical protein